MGSAVLVGGRFDDIQEFCFQAAKHSDLDSTELEGVLFAVRQVWYFEAPKVPL